MTKESAFYAVLSLKPEFSSWLQFHSPWLLFPLFPGYCSIYSLVTVPSFPWLPFCFFPGYRCIFSLVTVLFSGYCSIFALVAVPFFPGYCIFSLVTVASLAWLLFQPFHCPCVPHDWLRPTRSVQTATAADGNSVQAWDFLFTTNYTRLLAPLLTGSWLYTGRLVPVSCGHHF